METKTVYIKEDELWPWHRIEPATERNIRHQKTLPKTLIDRYEEIEEKLLTLNRILGYFKRGCMSVEMIELGLLNEEESKAVLEADKQGHLVSGIPESLKE